MLSLSPGGTTELFSHVANLKRSLGPVIDVFLFRLSSDRRLLEPRPAETGRDDRLPFISDIWLTNASKFSHCSP